MLAGVPIVSLARSIQTRNYRWKILFSTPLHITRLLLSGYRLSDHNESTHTHKKKGGKRKKIIIFHKWYARATQLKNPSHVACFHVTLSWVCLFIELRNIFYILFRNISGVSSIKQKKNKNMHIDLRKKTAGRPWVRASIRKPLAPMTRLCNTHTQNRTDWMTIGEKMLLMHPENCCCTVNLQLEGKHFHPAAEKAPKKKKNRRGLKMPNARDKILFF